MGKVARLPDFLINQIAAGEVVERPAAVVKELCENSLDAGARSIRVELSEGGLKHISVTDDGVGMSPEDARLCLERHATSKLRDLAGLSHIATMGFRGEALPSIASVSRMTLITREASAVAATRIQLEGGVVVEETEAGAPVGTQILIEDLFFNTPARQKFSKKSETELGHCADAVIRLALARPDVAFHLSHHGRVTFASPATDDLRERMAAALSPEVHKHLLAVDRVRGAIRVHGLTTSPEFSLSTTRGLFTYVNRRFIRDRGLMHAIGRAYAHILAPGRQPAAVLFIEMPLDAVDVNVHPQKLEVRFVDAREVYDAAVEAIRATLRDSPWLQAGPKPAPYAPGLPSLPVMANDGAPPPAWTQPGVMPLPFSPMSAPPTMFPSHAQALPSLFPQAFEAADRGDGESPGYFSALRYVGQLARTYLLCEAPNGTLVILDQHAAHERLRFDQLRKQYATGPLKGQPFLFPVQLRLPLSDARALMDHHAEVAAVGFELEPFGGDSLALKSVPSLLVGADYIKLLTDLAHEFAQFGRGQAIEDAMGHVLATMACHSAVRAHQTLSAEEARALLDELDLIDYKTRCPHGRPVAAELPLSDLEKRVHRR
jgi:DNA mismatch repair protein MutL